MNTVPTCPTNANHAIDRDRESESTGPVFKMPSHGAPPLLLNIPPPIPLKWQLAVPSAGYISTEMERPRPTVAPLQIMVNSQKQATGTPPSAICVDDVNRILQQFGDFDDYDSCRNTVTSGFIHDLQSQISLIIPSDIHQLCSSFYFTKESRYIHFTYKLYVALTKQKMQNVSGKQLISIIENKANGLLPNTKARADIVAICGALVANDFLELSWYKTTFSSLFDESQSQLSFKASDDYVYTLTHRMIEACAAHLGSSTADDTR